MGSKKNSPSQKTKHHLIPRSRCQKGEGQKNIRTVPRCYHEAWHNLFANMTPFEVIVCIVYRRAPVGYFSKVELDCEWENNKHSFRLESQPTEPIERMITVYAEKLDSRYSDWQFLFRDKTFDIVIAEIVTAWAPEGFFQHVLIEGHYNGQYFRFSHDS